MAISFKNRKSKVQYYFFFIKYTVYQHIYQHDITLSFLDVYKTAGNVYINGQWGQ